MSDLTESKQTPLADLLRSVPLDARMVYDHSPIHSQSIPVGRLCKEAADALDAQAKEIEALRKDAERYRWLRLFAGRPQDVPDECLEPASPEIMDETIDAAMAAQEKT